MAATLTTRERVLRMIEHREADRIPVTDSPWNSTVERWKREGLGDTPWWRHFDLDRLVGLWADTSPRWPEAVIEETDEWVVRRTSWGVTRRDWKLHGGVPEYLDFTITDADAWAQAKPRLAPARDRVAWDRLDATFREARADGAWIQAGFWFGFDVTHSHMVGTERVLMALIEDPAWIVDMWNAQLDLCIAQFEMVWQAGYHFDAIRWPDDMGYKGTQFFSAQTYRELLKPVHRRAVAWAHAKGIKAELHSCGDIRPLIDDLIDIGIDVLNPLEVKAGMDPVDLKRRFGSRLCFHGGLNAALFDRGMPQLLEQMRQVIPVMKQGGGYIASSDHSVPDSVSLAQFAEFVTEAKRLGAY